MKVNGAKKILVIDDETTILEVVKIILKHSGYEVFTHRDGKNIAEFVGRYNPDLILLDVHLKDVSGGDLCKELKKTTDIPIVLFSGYANLKKTYQECKADGYIAKPFERIDLLNVISGELRKRA